jgi:hypothetical protein
MKFSVHLLYLRLIFLVQLLTRDKSILNAGHQVPRDYDGGFSLGYGYPRIRQSENAL